MTQANFSILPAKISHLDLLQALEKQCFSSDQLSRRSMRRFLSSEQTVFLVAMSGEQCIGYSLIIFHRGTRLARLYSIAVDENWRGQGVAKQLMEDGEREATDRGALYFRLEVNDKNTGAIKLYQSLGFKTFGLLQDYYEDHSSALRMQKRIHFHNVAAVHTEIPWCQQSTPFTCGPASLMMALTALKSDYKPSLSEELQLWREATTIYMTSGHGGCHPMGLALAAKKRGLQAEVWVSQAEPLFLDGVRSDQKRDIMTRVHHDFVTQMEQQNIPIHYESIDQARLMQACDEGAVPIVLISTYRMDKKKAPHWVAISGYGERCFYVHDPDPDENNQDLIDCQYMPISHEDFSPMSSFGSSRLRTAVIISKAQ